MSIPAGELAADINTTGSCDVREFTAGSTSSDEPSLASEAESTDLFFLCDSSLMVDSRLDDPVRKFKEIVVIVRPTHDLFRGALVLASPTHELLDQRSVVAWLNGCIDLQACATVYVTDNV